jgi:hypothetical protein
MVGAERARPRWRSESREVCGGMEGDAGRAGVAGGAVIARNVVLVTSLGIIWL